jgi:hypothetical protein
MFLEYALQTYNFSFLQQKQAASHKDLFWRAEKAHRNR